MLDHYFDEITCQIRQPICLLLITSTFNVSIFTLISIYMLKVWEILSGPILMTW